MITRPITTATFQMRVLALLDEYFEAVSTSPVPDAVPYPLVSPLTPEDTTLTPDESVGSMLAVTSPWIDLASPDPAVAHISRQVFNHEVAFAAFCGFNNVIVQGPLLQGNTNLSPYARAVMHALSVGPYLQMQILLPMQEVDESRFSQDPRHVASRARSDFTATSESPVESDLLKSWDAWELIRSLCRFHGRLSLGKILRLSHFLSFVSSVSLSNFSRNVSIVTTISHEVSACGRLRSNSNC